MGLTTSTTSPDQATDGYVYNVPLPAVLERLIRWHEKRADQDGSLALSLEAEGLGDAAETNRKRATAHRQTATYLKAFRERCCTSVSEFRGHLTAKDRPKAQVRAPP